MRDGFSSFHEVLIHNSVYSPHILESAKFAKSNTQISLQKIQIILALLFMSRETQHTEKQISKPVETQTLYKTL
jgi:hypothetical protein